MAKFVLREMGERIRQRRMELGLTQQQIYEILDISQNHYSRIENGHTGMSFELLLKISEILQISTDYILTGAIDSSSHVAFIEQYNRLTEKQKRYITRHIALLEEFDFK